MKGRISAEFILTKKAQLKSSTALAFARDSCLNEYGGLQEAVKV
ncbi:predicted protein [Sclerotinia sclerotiorum 1980 UF-70]|uniref:Uncharacterized protein n=1 Tax=Sclerotinia sclerotiorum (strain ATCC 18683 / 1980 / Ss-1) TaxID=665079 RepID=A7F2Y0_SCLS1|nr:predicted protein [Sclerotinia sclerotiorum 1980 UF-70]EDN96072.1 predicted protein [Sclerotinia sclerotiorum 1980 UF-70]